MIATEQEAAEVVRDMVVHQTAREKLLAEREAKKNLIDEEYAQRLNDHDTAIAICEESLALFATNHSELFEDAASIVIESHRIGYTPGKWKVEIEDGTDEATIVAKLEAIIAKGERETATDRAAARAEVARGFLSTKVTLDKARMIKDSKRPDILAFLHSLGVWFSKEDKLFIQPNRTGQKSAKLISALN